MTDGFVWDAGTDKERITEWPETKHILTEIHQEIEKNNRELVYSHKVMLYLYLYMHRDSVEELPVVSANQLMTKRSMDIKVLRSIFI